MSILSNTKIVVKISAVVAMLACVCIGISVYARSSLMMINDAYTDLVQKDSLSMLSMSRANRNMNRAGYAAYRVVGYSDMATMQEMAALVKTSQTEMFQQFDLTASLSPQYAADIAVIRADATAAMAILDRAVDAGLASNDVVADTLLKQADTAIAATMLKVSAITKDVTERAQVQSDMLTQDSIDASWTLMATALLVSLASVAVALVVATKGITGPLGALRGRMEQLAGGRLDVEVEGQERRDEVGQMAKAVQIFKDNALHTKVLEAEAETARALAESERGRTEETRRKNEADQKFVVASLAEGLSKVAEGDLTASLDRAFPPEYRQLQDDFNAAIATLKQTMTTVTGSVRGMKSQTDEIATASDDMSRRTEQQAAALEETAAALNEITLAVRRTAESAKQAADVTVQARSGAEKSGIVVRKAVQAMGEIEQSSDKISKIIGVIDEIAFQTNLLALNAGVEAARAGEAGRGFAVVAQEVRGLAQRSAEAAKEIKELISASTHQVEQGVDLVGQTGTALDRMVEQVAELTALVDGIAQSAKEQATGLHEVNAAVNQMDQVTQQNAAMVEQSTAANRGLAGEADELMGLMGQFRVGSPAAPARRPAAPRPASAGVTQMINRSSNGAAVRRSEPKTDEWAEF